MAAVALKLYGLKVSPVPHVGWAANGRGWVTVAAWECGLALWLLSGALPAGAWLSACGTFLAFAAYSGYSWYIGAKTCGCFGPIQSAPWHSFCIDLVALVLLALCAPRFEPGSVLPTRGVVAPVGITALVILGAFAGLGSLIYGSPHFALARLRGEALTGPSDYADLGSGRVGQTLEAGVEVSNNSHETVRVVGATSECSCVATSGLPLVVPPGEIRPVPIRLEIEPAQPGVYTQTVVLWWADHDTQKALRLLLRYRVVE